MAEEVRIEGIDSTAKVRNPLGVVGLSIITIGVYYAFWWYFINREMHDLGRARRTDLGQNPVNSVLALTLGALVIVPALVTLWTTSHRIERSQEAVGLERRANGPVIFILLLLIGPVGIWYAQNELNKVWTTQTTGGGEPAPLPAAQTGTPPPDEQRESAAARPEAPEVGPQAPRQAD
jgi:Domain of unknown function (DUF4234)